MKNIMLSALVAATTLVGATAASASSYWVQPGVELNARSGPSTQYHVIGKLHGCTKIHVVKYSHGWAKVAWNHSYYWVSAKYLQNHGCSHGHGYKKKHNGHGY